MFVEPYYADDMATVHHGDCLDVLRALPDASVDAVVTDPPYGLADHRPADIVAALTAWLGGDRAHVPDGRGFMGRDWDRFVPPPAVWDECLRVLKPGGHLLAFSGARTADLMGMSIRLAGFEIRDGIDWVYASGFPKSLDVSKAIDRQRLDNPDWQRVGAWLRARRAGIGMSAKNLCAAIGAHGAVNHGGAVSNWENGLSCPTWEQWNAMRSHLSFGNEMDAEVWRLNGRKGLPGDEWSEREVVGTGHRVRHQSVVQIAGLSGGAFPITAAATEDARRWHGWGTALKPAREPIVVARKPLVGTVAANVLAHGTGALNIDACRTTAGQDYRDKCASVVGIDSNRNDAAYGEWTGTRVDSAHDAGRWPTNVVYSHAPDCNGQCVPGCPVAELDRQSGVSACRTGAPREAAAGDGWRMRATGAEYTDAGGASRFFPAFRYEPKAPTSERPRVDGVAHSTVKPLDLMRWLVRLVTPPGGTVLEPFAGSGTTVEACILEGFRCIAVEREADYLPLITARLSKPLQPALDIFGGVA